MRGLCVVGLCCAILGISGGDVVWAGRREKRPIDDYCGVTRSHCLQSGKAKMNGKERKLLQGGCFVNLPPSRLLA